MTVRKWGGETLVNTNTPANQLGNCVTALADGGFAVAWTDEDVTGGDGNLASVKLRIFNADGTARTDEILVNTTTTAGQATSDIRQAPDGSIWVVFDDGFNGGNSAGVSFRRFSASGTAIDAADRVAVDDPGIQVSQVGCIDFLENGDAVITYATGANLAALRFLPNGDVIAGTSDVASTANNEDFSAVTALPGGGFAVVFKDATAGLIKLRLFDAAGVATGAATTVSNASANHFNPAIALLANGGFVVAWHDNSQTGPDTDSGAVHAQLFNAAGTEVGSEFTANTLTGGSQSAPAVQPLAGGGFAICYGSAGEIRGQIFDEAGARVGTEFLINTTTSGSQQGPQIARLVDGRIVVTWLDGSAQGGDTSGFAIRMQIIDPRDGVVTGTENGETLFGHELLNDEINGLGGADTLNGLAGADNMFGGEGGDTYVVDNAGDRAIELLDHGTDTVQASVSFTLGANVENLTLVAGAAGTGNTLANTITGNAAANTLNGLGGADTMLGRAGNDTYTVDNLVDTVSEAAGSGIDTVFSSIAFNLTASARVIGAFENLTLTGAANVNGTGNTVANILTGNNAVNILTGNAGNDTLRGLNGNDTLIGGVGLDTLTGGLNNDSFVFNAPLSAANRDTIIDFSHVNDVFRLENGVMPALGGPGGLAAAKFFAGAAAHDADDRIVYNQATGALFFDSNGFAAGGVTQLATLSNRPNNIAANDFLVI